jgi:hypothetical protein
LCLLRVFVAIFISRPLRSSRQATKKLNLKTFAFLALFCG